MRPVAAGVFLGWFVTAFFSPMLGVAYSQQGDTLRGTGAYLNGLGWYNLNTAKANAINADTVIKWKNEWRKQQAAYRQRAALGTANSRAAMDAAQAKQAQRERQLRTDPSARDVLTGDALDVLLYDLSDPDITLEEWQAKPVSLPEGMSVKDMIFRFTELSDAQSTYSALGKGVIALSRLDITGKWPISLKLEELKNERGAFEATYGRVHDEILAGDLQLNSLKEMDDSLRNLRNKAMVAVPEDRGYRKSAVQFVDDLIKATRMFDANTVEYAREIIQDTKEHDAQTVGELVAFMSKYRLQFASAEGRPETSELYKGVFTAFRKQMQEFGITSLQQEELFNGRDLSGLTGLGSIWSIKNGAIVGNTGPKGLAFNTYLCSNREYENFELTCNVRLIGSPTANSGIQFRSSLVDPKQVVVHGPQVDIGQIYWGSLYSEGGAGMLQQADKNLVSRTLKAEDFNELKVTCVGKRVTIRLNGQTTVDKVFPSIPQRGIIGWQLHSGKNAFQVLIKDVELKELP